MTDCLTDKLLELLEWLFATKKERQIKMKFKSKFRRLRKTLISYFLTLILKIQLLYLLSFVGVRMLIMPCKISLVDLVFIRYLPEFSFGCVSCYVLIMKMSSYERGKVAVQPKVVGGRVTTKDSLS